NSIPTLNICARLTPFKLEEPSRETLEFKTCEGSDVLLSLTMQQESNAELTGRGDTADKCAFSIKAMLTRAPVE
ncbi:MAG TPA: hypothetical protein VF544_08615, partial [Pyrinomonadaceae bacterium]